MFELFDPEADVRVTSGTRLPHWYQPGVTYFVTFRTEDSIPADLSRRWHAQRARWLECHGISDADSDWAASLASLPKEKRQEYHETFSKEYLEYLDRGLGACVLKRPELSKIVANSLLHFHQKRYYMGDFVVMPNHVHLLVCLIDNTDILKQCYSWKKFTATRINQRIGGAGRFWQEESFDHLVRSREQFGAVQCYIRENPRNLFDGEFHLHEYDEAAE